MSEQRDDLDELPYLTPYKLRTTGGVLMHRLCNDMKCGLESIKSEQERANVQTAQLMGEGEVNDKRVKTLEEKVSRLESKLNRIQAFGLAVIVITVLFWIQANWTSLAMALAASLRLLGSSKNLSCQCSHAPVRRLGSLSKNALSSCSRSSKNEMLGICS
jgi:hypothetical protein